MREGEWDGEKKEISGRERQRRERRESVDGGPINQMANRKNDESGDL